MKKLLICFCLAAPLNMGMLSAPDDTTVKYSMLSMPTNTVNNCESGDRQRDEYIEQPNTVQLGPIKEYIYNNVTPKITIKTTNKTECENQQTTITVPIWVLDGEEKVPSVMALRVNSEIAADLQNIFNEIYTGEDKQVFDPNTCGGFCYRNIVGTSSLSHHSYGTAVDLNWDTNPCYYYGHAENPNINKSPYAFKPDGDVVKIFKKHGWNWGGEWESKTDFMHFSCTES